MSWLVAAIFDRGGIDLLGPGPMPVKGDRRPPSRERCLIVLLHMAAHASVRNRGQVWHSTDRMAGDTGLDRRSVQDCLHALETLGLIARTGKVGRVVRWIVMPDVVALELDDERPNERPEQRPYQRPHGRSNGEQEWDGGTRAKRPPRPVVVALPPPSQGPGDEAAMAWTEQDMARGIDEALTPDPCPTHGLRYRHPAPCGPCADLRRWHSTRPSTAPLEGWRSRLPDTCPHDADRRPNLCRPCRREAGEAAS